MVKDGFILQPKAVGKAIDALFKSAKAPREQVIISLTGLAFTHRIISLPQAKPELLAEAIERAARKDFPLPPEELHLFQHTLGDRDGETDHFVLGVPRSLIDTIDQTIKQAGITSYEIEPKPLALARAANRKDAFIVSLEHDWFDIVLVADGIPSVMHTITPKGEEPSVEDNILRLADEVVRTMEFHNSSHPKAPLNPATPLLICGELADDATGRLLQEHSGHPVEPLAPDLEFPADLPLAMYAANMGLALKKASRKTAPGFHDIDLGMVPENFRASTRKPPPRSRPQTIALAVAIGVALFTYQLNSLAKNDTMYSLAELSVAGQELRQTRLAVTEASQMEEAINAALAESESLEEEHRHILGGEAILADSLAAITDALPNEARFTSIEAGAPEEGTRPITLYGQADTPDTVIGYAKTLQTRAGFSEVRIAEIGEIITILNEETEEKSTTVDFTIVVTDKD